MKKIIYCFLVTVLVVGLWLGCAPVPAPAPTLAPPPQKTYEIEILGGSATNYQASVAIADILTKYSNGRIKASATETIDADSNIAMSLEKDPNQVLVSNTRSSYHYAKEGLMDWVGKRVTDQRWVLGLTVGDHALVTLNPDIKTLADLKGKTIAILPGEDMKRTWATIFKKLGIEDEVTIKPMGFMEQYDALADELVDACLYLSTHVPGGTWNLVYPLMQVVERKAGKVYGIPVPAELVAYFNQELNRRYLALAAPPGTLPTQTEPLGVYSITVVCFTCRADADEELIYLITKTLVEQYSRLGEYAPFLRDVTPETFTQLITVDGEDEVHYGNLKYYKETGLWKAWEEFQKGLSK